MSVVYADTSNLRDCRFTLNTPIRNVGGKLHSKIDPNLLRKNSSDLHGSHVRQQIFSATDFFRQLIWSTCETDTDISHVCDTVIKETRPSGPPASFTDWQVVLCVTNMSQICQIWHICLQTFRIFFRKNTIFF